MPSLPRTLAASALLLSSRYSQLAPVPLTVLPPRAYPTHRDADGKLSRNELADKLRVDGELEALLKKRDRKGFQTLGVLRELMTGDEDGSLSLEELKKMVISANAPAAE